MTARLFSCPPSLAGIGLGRAIVGDDPLGPTLAVAGAGISHAGRPRLSIRLS